MLRRRCPSLPCSTKSIETPGGILPSSAACNMRIVVFGAGGFVGGWVCEELSQRPGIEQVACVRKWASAVRLARRGVDIRQADLEDADQVAAALAGADVVVNAAMPPPSREAELVTALYHASVRAGVRRFIQFSSAAVYGHRTGDVDERTLPAPVDDYSRGKAEMESRLLEAVGPAAPHLFILRPSIIYGPFSDAWTVRYVERIVKGRWRGLGRAGEGTCNIVHAHDVAKAAIAAATASIPPGVYVLNINGADPVTWNEYLKRLGRCAGRGQTQDSQRCIVSWHGSHSRHVTGCGSGQGGEGSLSAVPGDGADRDEKRPRSYQALSLGRRVESAQSQSALFRTRSGASSWLNAINVP